jgi:Zn-dependent protease with chaperone function
VTARILLALSLFAGFYLCGIGLVLALAWLPWAELRYTGSLAPSGIAAGAGALYILWALVPPRTRWVAPGVELKAESQPALHALIARVAAQARHPLPSAVYLVQEATAFAAGRPRWHGLRRDPVLGIGLPLFALFGEDELAAVLAHEFGHHAGGDVKLGPWQHRTFLAISAALDRLDGSSVFLHLPFYAYGRVFLRLTGAASREQELRADDLAARAVSPGALAGALVALERYHASWSAYWHEVFVLAVDAGFRPPMLDGYRRFLEATSPPELSTATPRRAPSAHDTHPPLEVRLTALGMPLRSGRDNGRCQHLLQDVDGVERLLLATLLTDADSVHKLEPIAWEEWGPRIVPATWQRLMHARMTELKGMPLSSLPSLVEAEAVWWPRLSSGVNIYSPAARRRQLCAWLGHWLALSLLDDGFVVDSQPGAEIVLRRGAVRLEPFRWVEDLASGARTADQWRHRCQEWSC